MPAATVAAAPTSPCVAVVGPSGVGKRALACALGAVPAPGSTTCFSWRARQLEIMREPQQLGCSGGATAAAVVVVVFDLTRKESFEAALAQWSSVSTSTGTSHTLLVGTKLDLPHKREVFHAEALQATEMQFDGAYVEVSARHAPFTGVDEVERVLQSWTCAAVSSTETALDGAALPVVPSRDAPVRASESASWPSSPVHDSRSSRDRSPSRTSCLRASVWLYDPTEDHPPSPEHDVKLRPISRALFEIRGAAHDKMKAAAKYRGREGSQLLQRSKYYGPTESSRHMRWHEEQKRLAAMAKSPPRLSCVASAASGHVRPRSASHGARSYEREHDRLATKSFVQPTELLRQRKLELLAKKALVLAASSSRSAAVKTTGTRSLRPPHATDQQQQQEQKRTKKSASAALPSVGDHAPSRHCEPGVAVPTAPLSSSSCQQSPLYDAGDAGTALASEQSPVDATTPLHCRKGLRIDTAANGNSVITALVSSGADGDAALPSPVLLAHLHSPVSPAASPRRERRATLGHVPCSVSTAELPDDVVVSSADEHAVQTAAAGGSEAVGDDAAGTEDATSIGAAASGDMAPVDALAAAPEAAAPFDWSADIDDMLDYFDGVTLPI